MKQDRPLLFISLRTFPILICLFVLFSGCGKWKAIGYNVDGISLVNMGDSATTANGHAYSIKINYHSDRMATYDSQKNQDDTYKPINNPTSINIYSLQYFDSLHPANSSLNDLFVPVLGLTSHLEDLITEYPDTQYDYTPTHDPSNLYLMKAPRNTGNYTFVVVMDFDDGKTFSDTTASIYLHP